MVRTTACPPEPDPPNNRRKNAAFQEVAAAQEQHRFIEYPGMLGKVIDVPDYVDVKVSHSPTKAN